jgi:hypothetical protein
LSIRPSPSLTKNDRPGGKRGGPAEICSRSAWTRCLADRVAAIVFDLDFSAPDGVSDCFGLLLGLFAQRNLFRHAGLLGYHHLLVVLDSLDRPLAEELLVCPRQRSVNGTALKSDMLLPERDLLTYRSLDHIASDADSTMVHIALADLQILLEDRDDLLATCIECGAGSQRRGRCGARGGGLSS